MRLEPNYIFYQFTSWCNSRCETCHLWAAPKETIPVEITDRMPIFFDPAPIHSVYLTGGEPLLSPLCVATAESLNRWKPGVRLISSTNGISPDLYLPRVQAMLDRGITIRFQVSLNGLEETHDKSRGVVGNYRNAIKMADGLHGMGVLASLNILMIPNVTTSADLQHLYDLGRKYEVPIWSSPVLRHNPWFGEEDDGAKVRLIQNCCGGTRALAVRFNGDITACQEPRPDLVFGNLRDDGLDPARVEFCQNVVRTRRCQPCGCCTNAFSEGMFVS